MLARASLAFLLLASCTPEDAQWKFSWKVEGKTYDDTWTSRGRNCGESRRDRDDLKSLREKSRLFICRKKVCGKDGPSSCSFDCDAQIELISEVCEGVPRKK